MNEVSESGLSGVKIVLLSSGAYNWTVYVAADSNDLTDLRIAKDKAVQVCLELSNELKPNTLDLPQKR